MILSNVFLIIAQVSRCPAILERDTNDENDANDESAEHGAKISVFMPSTTQWIKDNDLRVYAAEKTSSGGRFRAR